MDRRATILGLKPGTLVVTRDAVDRGWTEKLLLWPVRTDGARSVWLLEDSQGNFREEAVQDWQRVIDIAANYPLDFRGEVSQFASMVTDEELLVKIQRARAEARRLRTRLGVPDRLGGGFGVEPEAGVNWSGRPLAVPEPGVAARVKQRLTGKRPAAAATRAPDAGVLVAPGPLDIDGEDLFGTGFPGDAEPPLPLLVAPGPLDAPPGLVWVAVDPSYPSEMGTVVTLPPGSLVLGVRALRKTAGDGFRSVFCDLMVEGEIPTRVANLKQGIADEVTGGARVPSVPNVRGPTVPNVRLPTVGGAQSRRALAPAASSIVTKTVEDCSATNRSQITEESKIIR